MTNYVSPSSVPKKRLANGALIPTIGMGTFHSDKYDAATVANAVRGAIKAGYRMFDCAAVYGNEPEIGEAFDEAIQSQQVKREELFIISKLWNDMHGRGDVLLACAKTLKDLRLDYLDMYLVHWPFRNVHAPGCEGDYRNPDSTPFSADRYMETWSQMERLVDMGLVKSIGMSNMTVKKLEEVLPRCRIMPIAHQFEMHPAFQQEELFDYCVCHDIMPFGYCPIGSPNRPERDRVQTDISDIDVPVIVEIAKAHGIHPALVCLKWAVQRGHIPIPFTAREENYVANLKCVTQDPLTDAEMKLMECVEAGCRLVKGQVFLWPGAVDYNDLWD